MEVQEITREWLERWTCRAEELSWIGGGVRALQKAVQGLAHIEGDIVECGSFRGGTAIALAAASAMYSPHKKVYAFDTFDGMPFTDPIDGHEHGDFHVTIEEVQRDTKGLDNLILVPGDYKDTVPDFNVQSVSLLFMDCDLYRSHMIAYRKFVPLMPKEALVIVEDYTTTCCKGCTAATEEFFGVRTLARYYDFYGYQIG